MKSENLTVKSTVKTDTISYTRKTQYSGRVYGSETSEKYLFNYISVNVDSLKSQSLSFYFG